MCKTIASILISLLLAGIGFAQPNIIWSYNWGTEMSDRGESVEPTIDGGYIVTGCRDERPYNSGGDIYLLKTDANGIEQWQRAYGGETTDVGFAIAQLPDSGYIISAVTYTDIFNNTGDLVLMITDPAGFPVWSQMFDFGDLDCGYAVKLDQNDDIVVAGVRNGFLTGFTGDVLLMKLNLDGTVIWNASFDFHYQDAAYDMDLTADGGYVLCGATNEDEYGGSASILLMKTDANGNLQWHRVLGQGWGCSVIQTQDGGFLLGAASQYSLTTDQHYSMIKTDSQGNIEWSQTWGYIWYNRCNSVIETADGYVSVGTKFIVKTDFEGNNIGINHNPNSAVLNDLCAAPNGNYTATGIDYPGVGNLLLLQFDDELGSLVAYLDPVTEPLTVPQGGSFNFDITLINNTSQPKTVDLRLYANRLGWVTTHLTFFRPGITLAPGDTLLRSGITQFLPAAIPLRLWNYLLYISDNSTDSLLYIRNFVFEVTPAEGAPESESEWNLAGWSEPEETFNEVPSEYTLFRASPNPFNPETSIRFDLPQASLVTLDIFDITGRSVGVQNFEPLHEWMSAGSHSVTFDGSDLASGIYFARLQAGDFTGTQKLLLVK